MAVAESPAAQVFTKAPKTSVPADKPSLRVLIAQLDWHTVNLLSSTLIVEQWKLINDHFRLLGKVPLWSEPFATSTGILAGWTE